MESGSLYILVFNALLYLLLFYKYYKSVRRITPLVFVLALYGIISVVAISLYVDPISDYKVMKLWPFLYLFLLLFVSFYPLAVFERRKNKKFKRPSTLLISLFSWMICFVALLFIVKSIPKLGSASFGDVTDVASAYADFRGDDSANKDFGIIDGLNSIFRYFYIFLLFYYFSSSRKEKYVFITVFSIAVIVSVLLDLSNGVRGPILGTAFQVICALLLFLDYYSVAVRKRVKRIMIVLSGFMIIAFSIITIGRFSSEQNAVENAMSYYAKSYASQSFLNFNQYGLDNGGLRYGDKTVPIIRKIMGLSYSKSYMERRNHFWQLHMDDSVFYTFIGDFTLDFGPVGAAVVLLIIFLFYYVFLRRKGPISLGQLIVVYFIFIKCANGFTLYPFAEMGGNRALLFMIFVAMLFDVDVIMRSSLQKDGIESNNAQLIK